MSLPLESVKRIQSLKETLLKQAEWEVAEAAIKHREAEVTLELLKGDYQQAVSDFAANQSTGLSAAELMNWTEWLEFQRKRIVCQNSDCSRLAAALAECQNTLLEKHRDREMWLRLQEKQTEVLKQDALKREQAELDDIGNRTRQRGFGM